MTEICYHGSGPDIINWIDLLFSFLNLHNFTEDDADNSSDSTTPLWQLTDWEYTTSEEDSDYGKPKHSYYIL